MDFQPRLTDGIVSLRPLEAEDRDALYAIASDPALWALHPAHDRWREPVFRAWLDAGLDSGTALVVEDAATGTPIGYSRYGLAHAQEGEVEIGSTFLARAYWGGPVNRAMKRLMIGHALAVYERVIFLIGEDNLRSRRAMEKIGGHLTDRRVGAEMAGRIVSHLVYAIDRPGFASGPLAPPLV
ncbi:MAG: GNAT family N-acetyltransferase [Sphingobium sp.]